MTKQLLTKQIIDLTVTSLGSSGEGVGKVDGFAVFAVGALPGETVRVKLNQVKKTYATGQVIKVVTTSKERVAPLCPVYKECGGCQLQHLSYEGQLKAKHQQVVDALERIGHFHDIKVLPTIGDEIPWHYRNKMQVPVAMEGKKIEIGCFAQATHKIIDVEECFIQKEKNNVIAAVVRKWMKEYKIPGYMEDKQRGIVRHIMGRVGVRTGEVMVVLVTATPTVPHAKELVYMLQKEVPGFKTLVQNINTRHTNVILGEKNKTIFGPGSIKDKLGDLSFNISAQSFFQVNSEQAQKLYDTALEYAKLTGKETVVDVYCGTGTITLFLAQKAKNVFGIEIVASAIKDAKINAKENKIANANFILGDAAKELPNLLGAGIKPDVIVLDPPRAGCEVRVLEAIASVKPKRIVYVSCNPATLARDLVVLTKAKYKITKVQPVDMFPQTSHVECVALMSRVQK
ncbi:MAG: 23S rRNA (uracil(1939)-C(5))-methyltransferase RlmD [Acidaminococcaceae bacterium]|nr:23S rRNA (uracil(1939)-C(5))-methyltransferase RlmD [Acidaminococcaceae bacterium]